MQLHLRVRAHRQSPIRHARVLGTTEDPNPPHEQEEQQIEDALARELLAVYTTLAADKKAMLLYLAKALAEPGKSTGT